MAAVATSVLILQEAINANVQTRSFTYHQIIGHVMVRTNL